MASNSGGLFGWELLYRSVQSDIKNNQDILVCFTHLVLVSNGFKCIGLGDSKILEGTETKTETLPAGWNDNYAIRYVYQGRLYNLRATNVDDAVMINLIRVQERTVSMVQLNVQSVAQTSGTLEQMIPNHAELEQMIRKQLIEKVTISTKMKDGTSQTTASEPTTSTSGVGPDRPSPLLEPIPGRFSYPSVLDPINNVGRSDLDPFGGPNFNPFGRPGNVQPAGGGMIFVPPRAPLGPGPNLGIPPDSIPPGARFDPFRPPPDPDRPPRRHPDNDDFPPPGFDDMYM